MTEHRSGNRNNGNTDEFLTKLVEKMLGGELYALSRLISLLEEDGKEVCEIMKMTSCRPGRAYTVGITGLQGSGKSMLVNQLIAIARGKNLSVGVVAVDPTSPLSGGAVLGDRIRMEEHALDPGVFIRSMASRGCHGGIPRTVRAVASLLSVFGKELILEETMGVGQTEIDVIKMADTSVGVLVPEAGDGIQAIKAGLMEVADIFVINKADRQGAETLRRELELTLSPPQGSGKQWEVPIILTQAVNNIGIDELYRTIEKHRAYVEANGELERRRQYQRKEELLSRVEERFLMRVRELVIDNNELMSVVERVENGELDVYTAVDAMDEKFLAILRTAGT